MLVSLLGWSARLARRNRGKERCEPLLHVEMLSNQGDCVIDVLDWWWHRLMRCIGLLVGMSVGETMRKRECLLTVKT
jgi:hypothetical protein